GRRRAAGPPAPGPPPPGTSPRSKRRRARSPRPPRRAATTPGTRPARRARSAALPDLAEGVVEEHERDHRLDDGDGARQDARVVAAARLDRRRRAVDVHGLLLAQDRRRRLERHAQEAVLPLGDPPLGPAGVVGAPAHPPPPPARSILLRRT